MTKSRSSEARLSPAQAVAARRETQLLPGGVYTFRDHFDIAGTITATVVTCTGWLLEHFDVEAGTVTFPSGNQRVHPPGRQFWIFYPPFTMTRISLEIVRATVTGRADTDLGTAKLREVPFVFEAERASEKESLTHILARASNIRSIDLNPQASSLSMKARKLIAESHVTEPSIARIAARLGVSNAHLSRQFRRDYGMSPRQYLHRLRIADVPLLLARGESIAEVSLAAGYGDLTRFYKQFRNTTHVSPGRCRSLLAPNRG